MNSVVAIGDAAHVEGSALAGAIVKIAVEPAAVREAWESLPDDVGLVVLSATAAATLREARPARRTMLTVAMPA